MGLPSHTPSALKYGLGRRSGATTIDPDDIAYFENLWARRDRALTLGYVAVTYRDGAVPRPGQCHANVDRWVAENPNDKAVRGWAFNYGTLEHGNWVAHSVVKRRWRPLFDISVPIGCLFLRHHGEAAQFERLRLAYSGVWLPVAAR